MFKEAHYQHARELLARCEKQKKKLATAESCTGGMVAALLTAIPGCSHCFERGFVTYTNEAKHEMLGVPQGMLDTHGAVSEAVAKAMAEGAIRQSNADIAVSLTGIAGPEGGSEEKPVGLVWIGSARRGQEATVARHIFEGDRGAIRLQATLEALRCVEQLTGG